MNKKEAKVLGKFGQGGNQLRPEIVRVDPSVAAAWLESSRGNRRISHEHVKRLAEAMTSDCYITTHQGVAFDCDGTLVDGHHTLWAVLLSGCTIELMVTRNLRREAIRVIDTGKNRSLQDRLTLDRAWGAVSRAEVACLRRMMRGRRRTMKRSPTEEFADWKANVHHVRFALMMTEGFPPRLRTTAVRAVVARAHKTIPEVKLQRFCFEIRHHHTGLLDSLKDRTDAETYDQVERALWCFCHEDEPLPSEGGF